MPHLPELFPTRFAAAMIRQPRAQSRSQSILLVDQLAAMERREARRQSLYWRLDHKGAASPARWHRAEPRPSIQYAGHMSTEAARDPRLARGAVSLLLILRARSGHGITTETTKTTLAHILHVTTRTIGRWLHDLVRFGYIEAKARIGQGGLYTGLKLSLAEKVLACFRKVPWLAGWLAQNQPTDGGNPDRTQMSDTNHSFKNSSLEERKSPG